MRFIFSILIAFISCYVNAVPKFDNGLRDCTRCSGGGKVSCPSHSRKGCIRCGGSGYVKCSKCGGRKKYKIRPPQCKICGMSSIFPGYGGVYSCAKHQCLKHNLPMFLVDKKEMCYKCNIEYQRNKLIVENEKSKKLIEEMKEKEINEKVLSLEKNIESYFAFGELCSIYNKIVSIRKTCKVCKWSSQFAPKFGGDYYTEQTKVEYERNKMFALKTYKCTCDTNRIFELDRKVAEISLKHNISCMELNRISEEISFLLKYDKNLSSEIKNKLEDVNFKLFTKEYYLNVVFPCETISDN